MNKVIVVINQNQRQAEMLRTQFINSRRGEPTNAIKAAQLCNELWGIKYDWHDWSETLAVMEAHGSIERIGTNKQLAEYWIK